MKKRKLSPTLLFLLTFFIGMLLSYIFPWNITHYLNDSIVYFLGLIILSISFLFNIFAYREFKKALTPYEPFVRPKVLIINGIFTVSRNPVYLALIFSEFGLAFVFDSIWIHVTAFILWLVLDILIVRDEEKMLYRTFKNEYIDYRKTTRRWI